MKFNNKLKKQIKGQNGFLVTQTTAKILMDQYPRNGQMGDIDI